MRSNKLYSISIIPMLLIMLFQSFTVNDVLFNTNIITEHSHRQIAKETVKNMTIEEKIGQMFIVDASVYNGDLPIGGVILFQNNLIDTDQIVKLTDSIQKEAKIPYFVGIDQEGGRVNRLSMATNLPGNMALGATGSSYYSYTTGKVIGTELSALGINVNFAPVLDVNNNPINPIIGVRSYSSDPELVGRLGTAFMLGLRRSKVIPTGKHFPGHGDTSVDSHIGLPRISHGIERLTEVELKPFKRAIDRRIDMILTAHVTFPTIDNTTVMSKLDGQPVNIPATLSYKVITGLLREEMGFNGVVVTDAFNMKAIADHFDEKEAVTLAINAGADIILMPLNLDKVYNWVLREVKVGNISEDRIDLSVLRIIELKSKYGILTYNKKSGSYAEKARYAKGIVGSTNHKEIEQVISDDAVTVLINENILPLQIKEEDNITLVMPNFKSRDRSLKYLNKILESSNIKVDIDSIIYRTDSQISPSDRSKLDRADYIILGTNNINPEDLRTNYVNNIISYSNNKDIPLVTMSIGNPYDIMYLNDVKAYVTSYGDFEANIQSLIKVILGESKPQGNLPVEIPNKENTKLLFELGHGLKY